MGIASLPSFGQTDALSITPPSKVNAKRGESVTASVQVALKPGFHVNSNTPAEEYLIPMKLTWDAKPLELAAVSFPEAKLEKHTFSDKPVSVYTKDFTIETKFKVPSSATPGLGMAAGKLRYQACNDTMCFPPKTLEVKLPFEVR